MSSNKKQNRNEQNREDQQARDNRRGGQTEQNVRNG